MCRYTYKAASGAFAAANGTSPFFTMTGVDNKVLAIHRIYYNSPTMTSPGFLNMLVKKYSSPPTGGTSTTLDNVPVDSQSPASSAVVKTYTAAPSGGTAVGNLTSYRCYSHKATPNSDGLNQDVEFLQNNEHSDYIVLRGASESVCISFESAPGGTVTGTIRVEWCEE